MSKPCPLSPTIGLPPPEPESCLVTSRVSQFQGRHADRRGCAGPRGTPASDLRSRRISARSVSPVRARRAARALLPGAASSGRAGHAAGRAGSSVPVCGGRVCGDVAHPADVSGMASVAITAPTAARSRTPSGPRRGVLAANRPTTPGLISSRSGPYCQLVCNELLPTSLQRAASSSQPTANRSATSRSFHCHGACNVTRRREFCRRSVECP